MAKNVPSVQARAGRRIERKRIKKSPGPLLPWACYCSPIFVTRISWLTKVVQRGRTGATKWH